jgi:hypothetical protein
MGTRLLVSRNDAAMFGIFYEERSMLDLVCASGTGVNGDAVSGLEIGFEL